MAKKRASRRTASKKPQPFPPRFEIPTDEHGEPLWDIRIGDFSHIESEEDSGDADNEPQMETDDERQ